MDNDLAVEVVDRNTGEIQEVSQTPEELLVSASEAARALERVISLNERPPVVFNGKRYLEFQHWQTLAAFYKVTTRTLDPEFVEIGGVQGFRAKAEVIDTQTGRIVGGAEAYCMKDEPNWAKKPTFQLASMAQTRAAVKALANKFRFVAIVAGYEGTPREEMVDEDVKPSLKMPKEKAHQPVEEGYPVETEKSKFFDQLHKVVREKNLEPEKIKTAIKLLFNKESSKDLTDIECAKLIKTIESGGIR